MPKPAHRKGLSISIRFPSFFGNAALDLQKAEKVLEVAQSLLFDKEDILDPTDAYELAEKIVKSVLLFSHIVYLTSCEHFTRVRSDFQVLKLGNCNWSIGQRAMIKTQCKELKKDAESALDSVKTTTAMAALKRFQERALNRKNQNDKVESPLAGVYLPPRLDLDSEEDPLTPRPRQIRESESWSSLLATAILNSAQPAADFLVIANAAQMSVVTMNSSAGASSYTESSESPTVPVAIAVEMAEQAVANVTAQIDGGGLPPGVPS